jgi:uncharacterized protein
MTSDACKSAARDRQRMIIGPWMHGAIGQRRIGEFDFGPEAEINLPELQRQWFDAVLRGKPNDTAPVRVFVMGRNVWVDDTQWPLSGTRYVPFYLHSGGSANGRLGDGALSPASPGAEPVDKFRFDPDRPVPYATDFNWKQVGGPDDFSEIELRDDILVYTTEALVEPLFVCGPLRVELFAASSALDTDWTAKILNVYPDGRAIRLNDGAVRARFRSVTGHEELITPGKAERYSIDCWATCIELAPGHRLRLEISSSAFGKFDVNLNGGGRTGTETEPVVAHQVIYHDVQRPSHLLLPVARGLP